MMRSLLFLLLLPLTTILSQVLAGKIVSCSGWQLNQYPHVKSFLKEHQAESYTNVELEYAGGKPAVLSIYVDGDLRERVDLFNILTLDDLHKMMMEKGFELMSDEDIAAMKKNKWAEVLAKREKMLKDTKQRRVANAAARTAAQEGVTVEDTSEEGEL